MTSNLGADYDEGSARFGFRTDDGSPQARNEERALRVREALSSQFRPEFLNRIDRIVCFNQLGRGTLASILDQLIEELVQRLATRGVELEVSADVRASIVAAANLDQGVPPLKRLLRERILSRVAAMLVEHDAADSLHVQASLRDGNIHLEVAHEPD
jgi:ATP-dependent Clp protease ATP-binding subunit ClpA